MELGEGTPWEQKNFYRYMSREEAEAVMWTGMLRGGRPGRTYWDRRAIRKLAGGQEVPRLEAASAGKDGV